ncbi:Unknown protein, partial [Striga hermonthica]
MRRPAASHLSSATECPPLTTEKDRLIEISIGQVRSRFCRPSQASPESSTISDSSKFTPVTCDYDSTQRRLEAARSTSDLTDVFEMVADVSRPPPLSLPEYKRPGRPTTANETFTTFQSAVPLELRTELRLGGGAPDTLDGLRWLEGGVGGGSTVTSVVLVAKGVEMVGRTVRKAIFGGWMSSAAAGGGVCGGRRRGRPRLCVCTVRCIPVLVGDETSGGRRRSAWSSGHRLPTVCLFEMKCDIGGETGDESGGETGGRWRPRVGRAT